MNIRYRFRAPVTGDSIERIFSLEEIEHGEVKKLTILGWQILSRDLGTGKKDKNGIEAFQADRVRYEDNEGYDRVQTIYWSEEELAWMVNGLWTLADIGVFEVIGREESP